VNDLITFKQPIETKLLVNDVNLHNSIHVCYRAFIVKLLTWEPQSPEYCVLAEVVCEKMFLMSQGRSAWSEKVKKIKQPVRDAIMS